ncbi:MAG: choline-sulfatase [Candidatus Latescibacteria bacterium]|jgi:choline-sulfatase|nr:choline-sulfatase [Candidatus Latescibacterota bacterium]
MPEQPNILVIISDQMISSLTGAYGHPVVQTPALNQMAEEGIRFDAAYSPFPLCSPARACLMTGNNAAKIGAFDNASELRSDIPTFAHHLTNAGYDTVLSGKMHFVGPDQLHGFNRRLTTDIYPENFSWVKDEWIQLKENKGQNYEEIMSHRASYHSRGYHGHNIKVGTWNGPLSYDEETHFRSLEYLHAKGNQKNPNPFLLCASYHHPHEPFWPPQSYWDRYKNADIQIPELPDNLDDTYSMMDNWLNAYHGTRRNDLRDPDALYKLRRAYYGLVSYMDNKVGELLVSLKENGLDDNTIVIFFSDHGDMLCEKEMVQKRTFYDWSSRVPFLIRLPDQYKAGTTVDQPISLVDLLPTLCDMAGVQDHYPCDGNSIMNLIDGSETEDREIFVEAHEAVGSPCLMIRKNNYKYNYIHGYDPQLFDLDADPGEWNNLSGQPDHAEIETYLRSRILNTYDPDAIADANLDSLYRRKSISQAMQTNGTSWAHDPGFDPNKNAQAQYLS